MDFRSLETVGTLRLRRRDYILPPGCSVYHLHSAMPRCFITLDTRHVYNPFLTLGHGAERWDRGIVYVLVSPISGKPFYVGTTSLPLDRASKHGKGWGSMCGHLPPILYATCAGSEYEEAIVTARLLHAGVALANRDYRLANTVRPSRLDIEAAATFAQAITKVDWRGAIRQGQGQIRGLARPCATKSLAARSEDRRVTSPAPR